MSQGVFFNLYTLFYILSPKHCHAFVGYLEEEVPLLSILSLTPPHSLQLQHAVLLSQIVSACCSQARLKHVSMI